MTHKHLKTLVLILGSVILVLLGLLIFAKPAQTPTQGEPPAVAEPAY